MVARFIHIEEVIGPNPIVPNGSFASKDTRSRAFFIYSGALPAGRQGCG